MGQEKGKTSRHQTTKREGRAEKDTLGFERVGVNKGWKGEKTHTFQSWFLSVCVNVWRRDSSSCVRLFD